jgi:uncharacterized protein
MGHRRETRARRERGSGYTRRVTADQLGLAAYDLSRVGLFPLPNVVLFPEQNLSLHVFEPRYRKLVSDVLEQGLPLAVPRLEPGFDADYYGAPPLFPICGVGQITEYSRLPDGRYNIVVLGLGRARIVEELRSEPYRVARIEPVADRATSDALTAELLRTKLLELFRRAAPHLPGAGKELESRLRTADTPARCADVLAGALIEDADERQRLLEELDPSRRLTSLIAFVHELASRLPGARGPAPDHLN